jgi:hypothetical protein
VHPREVSLKVVLTVEQNYSISLPCELCEEESGILWWDGGGIGLATLSESQGTETAASRIENKHG